MDKLYISVHSFVDVITNSSTELFVGTHNKSIEFAKDTINEILKIANVEKTADDLFEFKLYDFDLTCESDCWYDRETEDDKNIDDIDNILKEKELELRNKHCPGCDSNPSSICIKSKGNDNIEIGGKLKSIFLGVETYN